MKLIAPDGHTVAHAPHPMHKCGSTLTWSPSALMAAVEQMSMHWVHPILRERPCAQIEGL